METQPLQLNLLKRRHNYGTERTSRRKIREGIVSSDKMDKTITVNVIQKKSHPIYQKTMISTLKLKAHDAENDANEGDRVEIMETRPLSKSKRWRLSRIIERKR